MLCLKKTTASDDDCLRRTNDAYLRYCISIHYSRLYFRFCELATAISSVRLGSLWGSYIPLILGGVLAILPDITGRELDSQKEGRRATYFLAVGSIGAFVFSLAADFPVKYLFC